MHQEFLEHKNIKVCELHTCILSVIFTYFFNVQQIDICINECITSMILFLELWNFVLYVIFYHHVINISYDIAVNKIEKAIL